MRAFVAKPTTIIERITQDWADDSGKYIYVKQFVDTKGNPITIDKTGAIFSVIVKQGEGDDAQYEIILITGIVQNTDGTARLEVMEEGRDIDPVTPYDGYASGLSFDVGAVLRVSNDAYMMSRYANLDEPVIFTTNPQATADPVEDNDLARKSYIDGLLAGTVTLTKNIVQGTAGADITAGQAIYFDTATNTWKIADKDTSATITNQIIGIAQSSALTGASIASGILTSGVSVIHAGLTPGLPVYVGSAGALTQIVYASRYTIGVAISDSQILVKTGWDYVPTAGEKSALAGTQDTPNATNKFVTNNDYRLVPTGVISPYYGASVPNGYLPLDGSLVSRTTYANLWAILKTTISTATISIATPGVITTPGSHGLIAGDKVYFTTTGALPSGLTANTLYYVISSGLTSTTFQLSATKGGSAINTSGTQSGTHTLIKTLVGLGDGSTTFSLPDYRGKTLVGIDTGTSDFAQLGNTGGEKTHTLTIAEMPSHYHNITVQRGGSGSTGTVDGGQSTTPDSSPTTQAEGGGGAHENMPPYGIVQWIIKY